MSDQAPAFSVVIPAYNYARYLAAAIDSVASEPQEDVEIIVVDDASTDDTPAVAARYGDRIRYLRNDANLGAAGAWARGIAAASGRYLVKLDADDELLPGHLGAVRRAFEAHPRAAMAIASVQVNNESNGSTRTEYVTAQDGVLEAPEFRDRFLHAFFFRMPGCALRREIVAGHEPPDPELYQVHDWEYFLRVTRGHPAVLLRAPGGVYRIHEASVTAVAKAGDRLLRDLRRWHALARRPGPRQVTGADYRVLSGSFAVLLISGTLKRPLGLAQLARFARAYPSALGFALHGGFGQLVRLHRALVPRAPASASACLDERRAPE